MRQARSIAPRIVASLIGLAALLTVGVTAFVYTGDEHREAVASVAREFFVLMERGSRAKRAAVSAFASPTPEGGVIR